MGQLIRAIPADWHYRNGEEGKGVKLFIAGKFAGFIPENKLTYLADRLVDIAEGIEAHEES